MVSETLRRWADPIWEQIFRHPFVVEVYRGDLPLEKFRYYLLQDYNYLVNFAKPFLWRRPRRLPSSW